MRLYFFRKFMAVMVVVFGLIMTASLGTKAQSTREWERDQKRYVKQQRRAAKEQSKWDRERSRRDSERYGSYPVYNSQRRRSENVYAPGYSHPAMQSGYQQGFQAGQADRRKGKYGRSNVYRSSGGAYPNGGDPSSADYVYRQGYLQGYDDGYRGVYR